MKGKVVVAVKKKKPTVKSVARAVKRLQRAPEIKNVLQLWQSDGLATQYPRTWQVFHLTGCAQGPSSQDRIGLEINPTSLQVQMVIRGCSDAGVPHLFRCIIIQDFGYDGSNIPQMSQILDRTSVTNLSNTDYLSSLNNDYFRSAREPTNRFKLLADIRRVVSPTLLLTGLGAYPVGGNPSTVSVSKTIRGLSKIHYGGTSSSSSSARAGHIMAFVFAGNNTALTSNCFLSAYSRLNFKDE